MTFQPWSVEPPARRRFRRRSLWLALLILVLLATAAGLVIFGSGPIEGPASAIGNGGAPVDKAPPVLAIHQTSVLAPMYPGSPPQALSGTFTNSSGGAVRVGTVTASLAGVTGARGSCALENFELSGAVMVVDVQVPVGAEVGAWSGATIRMLDTSRSQDGCQQATVQISYSAP